MNNMAGPFGPAPRGIPDLGARAQQAADEQEGRKPFPVAMYELAQSLLNEITGIRVLLTPNGIKDHHPTLMPVVGPDGARGGWGVFCLGCSDLRGAYVNPCEERVNLDNWPPAVVIAIDDAELHPKVASPGVPDTVGEM